MASRPPDGSATPPKTVRIYVLFHRGQFLDVYLSWDEAMRDMHPGGCCDIKEYDREEVA